MSVHQTNIQGGISLVYEHAPHARITSFDLLYPTGQALETTQEHGWTHMLASLIDQQSAKASKQALEKRLLAHQMIIDGVVGKHCLGLEVHAPFEHWQTSLAVAYDLLTYPAWTQADIHREAQIVKQYLQTIENYPDEVLGLAFRERMFGLSHVYATLMMGRVATLEGLTPAKLLDFYQHSAKGELLIHMVGRMPFDEVAAYLTSLFQVRGSHAHASSATDAAPAMASMQPDFTPKVINGPYQKCHGACGFPIQKISKHDMLCLEWIADFLVHATGGYLFDLIREDKGLAYEIDCQFSHMPLGGGFSVEFSCDLKAKDQVMELIEQTLKALCDGLVTPEVVEQKRKQLQGQFLMGWEAASSHVDYFNQAILYNRPLDYHSQCQKMLALTAQDIQNAAQSFFQNKPMVRVSLEPS